MSGGGRWSSVVIPSKDNHRISAALGAGLRGVGGHGGQVMRVGPTLFSPSPSFTYFPLYRGVLDHQGAATRPVMRVRGGGYLFRRRPPVTTGRPGMRGCAVVIFSEITTKVTTTAPDKAMGEWRGRA
jgi:hypothetical protein